ncbi:hypothetical protein BDN72DRAFT_451827 [Pluteus cervinus]|uniref:Uncharacterized protein n=1 Tax=Pluteus cervinus TaxID=181527 RepID=A0ACD3BFB0_9AGAR|nr:hypothetical protein BDN72DRAFT_451827 [Pluteus cervinus]
MSLSIPDLNLNVSSIDGILPDFARGTNLPGEIKCYTLPYGFLGFLSHLLTYYTIVCLWTGRAPLRPWREFESGGIGLTFSIVGLLGGFALSVYTVTRCRNTWQLVLLALWKMGMSIWNGVTAIHASMSARGKGSSEEASGWTFLYMPFIIVGFVGLASLIKQYWGMMQLRHLTFGFVAIIVGTIVYTVYRLTTKEDEGCCGAALGAAFFGTSMFCILAAFYSDWALGSMVGNLAGVPSSDNMPLYVAYIVLERFTMFTAAN